MWIFNTTPTPNCSGQGNKLKPRTAMQQIALQLARKRRARTTLAAASALLQKCGSASPGRCNIGQCFFRRQRRACLWRQYRTILYRHSGGRKGMQITASGKRKGTSKRREACYAENENKNILNSIIPTSSNNTHLVVHVFIFTHSRIHISIGQFIDINKFV